MSLTLLLDLDDTLLNSNLDSFVPAYFQVFSESLSDLVPPEKMLPALVGGTKRMLDNQDAGRTLKEVFDEYFYPKLNVDRQELQQRIEDFYDEIFPSLIKLTSPIPAAMEFVNWAFSNGFRVAIATSPLFPRVAIEQRLKWAGLDPDTHPFSLITSYECFHFAKPSPAYFAEVMACLGWPADPVLMVGNDLDNDVIPARKVGIPSYWVVANPENPPLGVDPLPSGTIASLQPWLEKSDLQDFQVSLATPLALLSVLRANPAAISSLTSPLDLDSWSRRPLEDEWNLTEIICHLRDVELEVHQPRLKKILANHNPFIAGEVTDPWAAEREYARQDGKNALADFTAARQQTLDLLSDLEPADWQLGARHAIFGPTNLQEIIGFMVEHEKSHIHQLWNGINSTSRAGK